MASPTKISNTDKALRNLLNKQRDALDKFVDDNQPSDDMPLALAQKLREILVRAKSVRLEINKQINDIPNEQSWYLVAFKCFEVSYLEWEVVSLDEILKSANMGDRADRDAVPLGVITCIQHSVARELARRLSEAEKMNYKAEHGNPFDSDLNDWFDRPLLLDAMAGRLGMKRDAVGKQLANMKITINDDSWEIF